MNQQLFANGAVSTLASAISSTATSLTLATGTGTLFPAIANGDYFLLTLATSANPETAREIVKVTAISTDTLTIVRAQESTTARAWSSGDKAEIRLTAGYLNKVPGTIPATSYRICAFPCRVPSINGGYHQVYSVLNCTATDDLPDMQIEYANYAGLTEAISSTATLTVTVGLEYPIGNDILQMFTWGRNNYASIPNGADMTSDVLTFNTLIPNGAVFRLHQHASTTGTIPLSTNGPSPQTNSNVNGFMIGDGNNGTTRNYMQLLNTSAARMALVASDNTSPYYFGPSAMIRPTNKRAFAFIGDSRGGGQNNTSPYIFDYPSANTGLAGPCERVYGGQGLGWVNLGIASDSLAIFLGTAVASGGGGRRMNYLKYVTDVVVEDGVNGLGAGAAAVLALETNLFNTSVLNGKRVWGMTVPPNSVTSTDSFITETNQTVNGNNAARVALNAQRLTDSRYTGGVLDFASIVESSTTSGKWKVGPNARVATGIAMTAGSNVVTGTGFLPADGGFDIIVVNTGTGGTTTTRGMAVYVSATQLNIVNRITGAAINAVTTQAATTASVQAFAFTGDGIHETQYADIMYGNAFAPVVAALLASQGLTQ